MYSVFILLWILAAIIFLIDPRNEINRWGAAYAFIFGCGGLSFVVEDNIVPYLEQHYAMHSIFNVQLYLFSKAFFLSFQYFFPYILLVFSMRYSGIFGQEHNKWKSWTTGLLLIPVIAIHVLFPIHFINRSQFINEPSFEPFAIATTAWMGFATVVSCYLLIHAYIRTKNAKLRQQRLITCVIILFIPLFELFQDYIPACFKIANCKNNYWLFIIYFVIFVFLAAKYGILGIKLRFEKHSLDNTMRAFVSGTAVMSHTIKNEIMKITMCADNIRANQQNIDQNMEVIVNSTNHMLAMMDRVQGQMQDIVLEESPNRLHDIIDKGLDIVRPYIEAGKINIIQKAASDPYLMCDGVHMTEVLGNLFKNAIEAMEAGGEIEIQVYQSKKSVTVAIRDNGTGISKENLPHIMEPFFSTKKRGSNFGLGLSYCYNVMQRHGGSLEIESREKAGTTVQLVFPSKKVLKGDVPLPKGEVAYG